MSAAEALLDWVGLLLTRIRMTGRWGIAWVVTGGTIGTAVALLLPRQFTSTATFIAQGASSSTLPSALQGIAASVGFTPAKDYSPQFYADLLTSHPVLTATLQRPYQVPTGAGTSPLSYLAIERVKAKDSLLAMEQAMRHLRRRVAARADVRTNIISVSVTARFPTLCRDLAQALLDALDSMNIGFRQQQSRELREFFESRVADAQHDLDSAETTLRQFLERNRLIEGSPLLTFEHMRLTRTADLKRAVYTTVVQQYEESKLQESRNVPVLTVLGPPTLPAKKSGPPRRFIVAAGLLIGLAAALFQTEARNFWARLKLAQSFIPRSTP